MKHELKIEAPYYQAVREGKKTFEIRYNDRGFNAGDTVILQPLTEIKTYDSWHPRLIAKIGYVTAYNQKENFVVFSLLNIEEEYNDD
jgi:ASC-1-like (ASCH) protein